MALIKLNNKAVSNATAIGSISSLGSMTFIKKLTASSSATLSFVHGTDGVVLDDTYKEYVFYFVNIHPANDDQTFTLNFSTDGGSNYNVVKTTTAFRAYNTEQDNESGLQYLTGADMAQGTGYVELIEDTTISNENDFSLNGYLCLYNPSSTTFVKHYMSVINSIKQDATKDYALNNYFAGYANTTSAINGVSFKMASGNIDAGDICLYGIA
jgi:hypothetical protein